jgi:hypothetical protein
MVLEFTVGINVAGKRESVTVAAEDALIAASKRPNAVINYAPTQQGRHLRHPHGSIAAKAD